MRFPRRLHLGAPLGDRARVQFAPGGASFDQDHPEKCAVRGRRSGSVFSTRGPRRSKTELDWLISMGSGLLVRPELPSLYPVTLAVSLSPLLVAPP